MGYPLTLALRYLGSRKRASISVGTMFAILGVALGVAALATVMSVTGGFQEQFREKVLGVNAHVLVLKYSTEFRDYRDVMARVKTVKGVLGAAPFSINPMMLTHGEATATGVLLKGVDPKDSLGVDAPPGVPPVLDLPRHIVEGESGTCGPEGDLKCGIEQLRGLRRADAKPADRRGDDYDDPYPPTSASVGSADAGPVDDWQPDASTEVLRNYQRQIHEDDLKAAEKEKKQREEDAAREKQKAEDEKNRPQNAPKDKPAPSAAPKDDKPKHSDVPKDKPTDAKAAQGDKPAPKKNVQAADPDSKRDNPASAADAGPSGNIVPDGGYKSVLPDDDELPPDLASDACADPARVKMMPGIIIGISLAKTLELKIGDCVTVTSPTIGYQVSGGSIRPPVAKSFRVMAIFEAGFDQYDSKLVYTDLYEAQGFYDQGDTVTGVEMKIADIEDSETVVADVKKALDHPSSYHIMDWKELNHGLFTALLIQKYGMSLVLALIMIVAAFTVVATLIMVVLDKKREIAVLKAMGATDWAVLRVFLYQGGFIGTIGTVLGLLVGLGVCKGLIRWAFPLDPKVYFISHLPVLIRPTEFIFTGMVAVLLCFVATVVPSLYAASLRPADGFREQ
jgi:lipoprotein-releasing system permease protein